ncbi:hypothetical protein [Ponticoccus litoralis]|uniref:Uncharacterized protein n=1 Tax=Ponticoccus litoralis TaxID=422297 RepID=A0AAW9SFP2_9RHOB
MSDPVTNVEIEDVLSSIRRLVTEETRPPRSKPEAVQPGPGRLVLTPSLRVHDAEPPASRAVSDAAPDPVLLTNPTTVSPGAADRTAAENVSPQPLPEVTPQAETARMPGAWRGRAEEKDAPAEGQARRDRLAESFWQQAGAGAVASVAEDRAGRHDPQTPVTDTVGQGDAAQSIPVGSPEAEPLDASTHPDDEDRNGTLARLVGEEVARSFVEGRAQAPLSDAPTQAGSDRSGLEVDPTAQSDAADSDAGDAGFSAEPLHSSGAGLDPLSQGESEAEGGPAVPPAENPTSFDGKIAALQKLLDRARPVAAQDAATDDMQERPTFVRSSTEAALEWEDHSPEATAAPAAEAEATTTAGSQDDPAEDTGGFDPVQARRDIDAEGDETSPRDGALAPATVAEGLEPHDRADGSLAEQAVIDEEVLRQMVSDIVRQELQGVLGERITRNVRKLVRREIHRVVMSQEFD